MERHLGQRRTKACPWIVSPIFPNENRYEDGFDRASPLISAEWPRRLSQEGRATDYCSSTHQADAQKARKTPGRASNNDPYQPTFKQRIRYVEHSEDLSSVTMSCVTD
jgi:hypothetical protein